MEFVIAATLLSVLLWAGASHYADRVAARVYSRPNRRVPASAVRG